ncbi:MAG: tripartite tricarboxylate transporter substrate binding protein [candidate division NC10 bacterium]|nr:tripartite tricarboxylate transporter substrate binding protein [candidate division NC10 bacterium]
MSRGVLRNADRGQRGEARQPACLGPAAQRALGAAGAILGVVLFVGAMVAPLHAQTYPTQSIRLIIPFAPGGGTDFLGRIIGAKLAERLGQPVVPENRPGGGSNVGIEFAAKARPDGYTIVIAAPEIATGPSLYRKLNYDPIKDFAPISLVAQNPLLLLVKPTLPVKSLKEFVGYAKANPGKVSYGSAGIGSGPHIAVELLKGLAKIDMLHAPYKGSGPAMIGLIGGEVDMLVAGVPVSMPHIQAGKVRALAVLGNERVPSLPDVPTAKEAGIDNFVVYIWFGVFAPAGTPRDIVNRLNAEWIKIAAMPDTKEQIQKVGLDPLSSTPEEFSEFIKAEIARWGKVIKGANIPSLD